MHWNYKRLRLHMSQVAYKNTTYLPYLCSNLRLGIFILLPGGESCPLQGYPPTLNITFSTIYTSGWRGVLWEKRVFSRNISQFPCPELESEQLNPETKHEEIALQWDYKRSDIWLCMHKVVMSPSKRLETLFNFCYHFFLNNNNFTWWSKSISCSSNFIPN